MKLKDKNTRKLVRLGKTSLATTLPKEMTDALGWKEKQRVRVKRIKGGIVIRDYRNKNR
ncbi:MAG: AbrB/MazE/SpoVT family DNA-binding domain-containing protein [Candidatus Moranbacteria bacterium]|nr:AbrB/MazE/SpoVT family DNA-binding domain-containing protein [Candidatus Moranbacteria bacterium]